MNAVAVRAATATAIRRGIITIRNPKIISTLLNSRSSSTSSTNRQLLSSWRHYHHHHQRWLSTTSTETALEPRQEHLPAKLIDFSISAKIEGEESQVAMVQLRPGETLRAESGAMLFMTHGVEMNTDLQGASAAFTRMMTGQNVFLTDFTYNGNEEEGGTVGLGTDFPSKIIRLSLEDYENSTLICQRGAYMASNPTVDIGMEATKSLSAGFFGGQGFILQRLSGQGDVLIKAGGTLVEKDLREGETLRVSSGSIVAFTSTVDYDIQMMPGIKNVMFGGEGLFVTKLTGPGKVWLQGMPPDRMIAEIASRVPSGGPGIGIPIGGGAGGAAAGGEEAAAGEGEGTSESGGEEMVASTDQAINADRQATVASSGMAGGGGGDDDIDADSPSALYGDAAPKDDDASAAAAGGEDPMMASSGTDNDGMFKETTFSDDDTTTTFTDETSFSTSSDETSFSDSEFQSFQEEDTNAWSNEDQTTTDVFDSGSSDGAAASTGGEEGGSSSIFSTLWDIFVGGDDD